MSSIERRAARRLTVDLELQVQLDGEAGVAPQQVLAHLVDLGSDGTGAGLHVPLRSPIMLGGAVVLLLSGEQPVRGIIVSRMGTPRYERLGIRIDGASTAQVRAFVDSLP